MEKRTEKEELCLIFIPFEFNSHPKTYKEHHCSIDLANKDRIHGNVNKKNIINNQFINYFQSYYKFKENIFQEDKKLKTRRKKIDERTLISIIYKEGILPNSDFTKLSSTFHSN